MTNMTVDSNSDLKIVYINEDYHALLYQHIDGKAQLDVELFTYLLDNPYLYASGKFYAPLENCTECSNYSVKIFKAIGNAGTLDRFFIGGSNKVHAYILEQEDADCIQISAGGKASDVEVKSGCELVMVNGEVENITIDAGGLFKATGGIIQGENIIGGTMIASGKVTANGADITFALNQKTPSDSYIVVNMDNINGAAYSITVDMEQTAGTYLLAAGAANFTNTIMLKNAMGTELGVLAVDETLKSGNSIYALIKSNDNLLLDVVTGVTTPPRGNLLDNGVSQILAWDASQGKVGYVATDGNSASSWTGIWEWSGAEASMWKVVGVGHFAGSVVDHDGILLYNGYGNTFAAWTNLNNDDYGYVSLCHVDGDFQTKGLAQLGGENDFDDVLIYNEEGSFGVVLDGAEYRDIWHVDDPAANTWELIGAGNFGAADDKDSLLMKKTDENAYFLWHNNDSSFETWDWSQSYIGSLDNDWQVAGIGDFSGDGIDDIAMWRASTGEVQIWEDAQASNQRYAGSLSQNDWEIAAVGDYNGDGKEDLLLRELLTGWGGIGYWAGADAAKWVDLDVRIETNRESQFAIIA